MLGVGDTAGAGVGVGQCPRHSHSQRGDRLLNREFRRAHGDIGEVRDIWEPVTEVVRSCPEEVRSSPNTLHLKPKCRLFTWPFKALDGRPPFSLSPASAHSPLTTPATLLCSDTPSSVLPPSFCTHWTLCLESSLPGWLAVCLLLLPSAPMSLLWRWLP